MKYLWYSFLGLISLGLIGAVAAVAGFIFILSYYGQDLPDYKQLENYQPPIVTRIYAGDGRLMAEFAKERRVFMPIDKIPDRVKYAFIAAEDKNFYTHDGLDYFAIARAAADNIKNLGTGRRPRGASTITQQVAKNFLLTNEVSFERKIKEAILAFRIEQALPKDKLLELYLNEIYLGGRSYGVAAAALYYFDKALGELEIHEAAYLGALPKGPNNYHPVHEYDAAIARRNWVIGRMYEDGYITEQQAELAKLKPLGTVQDRDDNSIQSPYFAEEVRRELADEYSEDRLYTGGLVVRSTMNAELQEIAVKALRGGLMDYDMRHGYRGPLDHLKTLMDWRTQLRNIPRPQEIIPKWDLAVVLDVTNSQATLGFANKPNGILKLDDMKWARKYLNEGYARGPEITNVPQVLTSGDVIVVESLKTESLDANENEEEQNETENEAASTNGPQSYALRQVPDIQGAIIVLDPHTGRVLAMQGGWAYIYGGSEYNRATQAQRQPGSAFKPFVYLAALDNGFTPATLVLDAPFVIEDRPGHFWRPTNYSGEFYGPTPIRVGVEKSKNLMTVRLADFIGMDKVAEYASRFGINPNMNTNLASALGSTETTLLKLSSAYAKIVNGGKNITPTFVDRIQDRYGQTIFKHDRLRCPACGDRIKWQGQDVPYVPDTRIRIADPRTTYQMVSILEGVVQRGTGVRLRSLGVPLAGKTGTTNESKDAWFIGFTPDLVVGVFTGFDNPRSLGKRETGSSVAIPIFKAFMEEALKDIPPVPFRVPEGIRHVQINPKTGTRARFDDDQKIWEAFLIGTEPGEQSFILDGGGVNPYQKGDGEDGEAATTGTGGLY